MSNVKLTPKQKEVVKAMRDGHLLIMGQSEFSGKIYYMVAGTKNNGYGNTYFNATVFSNLMKKEIIYQENAYPFNWKLTEIGETIKL